MSIKNRIIDVIRSVSLTNYIGINLLLGGGYYYLFFDDGEELENKSDQIEKEFEKLNEQHKSLEDSLKNKIAYEKRNKKLFETIENLNQYFSPVLKELDIQEMISENADKSGIDLEYLKTDVSSSEYEEYQNVIASVSFVGSFNNLMNFISKMTELNRIVDMKDMHWVFVKTKEFKPEIRLTMALFFYNSNDLIVDEDENENEKK